MLTVGLARPPPNVTELAADDAGGANFMPRTSTTTSGGPLFSFSSPLPSAAAADAVLYGARRLDGRAWFSAA